MGDIDGRLTSSFPINNEQLMKWYLDALKEEFNNPWFDLNWTDGIYKTPALYGDNPFSIEDLKAFIYACGLKPKVVGWEASSGEAVLVVGREGWEETILVDYINKCLNSGGISQWGFCVYSQEMFIFRLMTGLDPFAAPRDVLEEFGVGHPTLEYLADLGFDWPSSQVVGNGGGAFASEIDWQREGLLKYLGYKVGKGGIRNPHRRRAILQHVFEDALPAEMPIAYQNEWGRARTPKRLRKMANCLASFTRSNKRRKDKSELAIEHWETDLAWLRDTYYIASFQFRWPSTTLKR